MYDLLSIIRGSASADDGAGTTLNCGPDTAAFFRAAVDLHVGAGRGVGVSWDAARRAVEDSTPPVYAEAPWVCRVAETAGRTAALLSVSPAGWLGDIWEGTAGLDDENGGGEEEGCDGDGGDRVVVVVEGSARDYENNRVGGNDAHEDGGSGNAARADCDRGSVGVDGDDGVGGRDGTDSLYKRWP
jgi:hypothetical protein